MSEPTMKVRGILLKDRPADDLYPETKVADISFDADRTYPVTVDFNWDVLVGRAKVSRQGDELIAEAELRSFLAGRRFFAASYTLGGSEGNVLNDVSVVDRNADPTIPPFTVLDETPP